MEGFDVSDKFVWDSKYFFHFSLLDIFSYDFITYNIFLPIQM